MTQPYSSIITSPKHIVKTISDIMHTVVLLGSTVCSNAVIIHLFI